MKHHSTSWNRTQPNRVSGGSGFTLIELLVVIGIIGVLASLLLPALSRSKQQASKIECMSNLRQLQMAWELYASDHNGWLPRNGGGQDAGRQYFEASWTAGWLDYSSNNPDNTNTWIMLNAPYGSIGQYTSNPGIYKCPSDRSWALQGGGETCSSSFLRDEQPNGIYAMGLYRSSC